MNLVVSAAGRLAAEPSRAAKVRHHGKTLRSERHSIVKGEENTFGKESLCMGNLWALFRVPFHGRNSPLTRLAAAARHKAGKDCRKGKGREKRYCEFLFAYSPRLEHCKSTSIIRIAMVSISSRLSSHKEYQ